MENSVIRIDVTGERAVDIDGESKLTEIERHFEQLVFATAFV